jgi:hypothetical protein
MNFDLWLEKFTGERDPDPEECQNCFEDHHPSPDEWESGWYFCPNCGKEVELCKS